MTKRRQSLGDRLIDRVLFCAFLALMMIGGRLEAGPQPAGAGGAQITRIYVGNSGDTTIIAVIQRRLKRCSMQVPRWMPRLTTG